MPIYTFECQGCHEGAYKEMSFVEHDMMTHRFEGKVYLNNGDGHSWAQVFNVTYKRAMPEHFNHTVNAPVSSERDFTDKLKIQSEAMSVRMGFEHRYEMVDPGEPDAYGVTEDGIEETERRARNEGRVEPKMWL